MKTPTDWVRHASCRNHPVLGPDAWFQVDKGFPRNEGAGALLVCRRVCPVRLECRAWVTRDVNAIAGGGWFDGRGRFHEPKSDLYDANMAAAFLGVSLERVQRLDRKRLPAAYRERGRSWFHETDVQALAGKLSPRHGTEEAFKLHYIRGERPCQRCHALKTGQTEITGPTEDSTLDQTTREKGTTGSTGKFSSSRASEATHSLST